MVNYMWPSNGPKMACYRDSSQPPLPRTIRLALVLQTELLTHESNI